MEYRVAGLPQEIQDAIAEKHLMGMLAKSAAKPPVAKKQSMPATKQALQVGVSLDSVLNGCDQKQRDCAHARLALSAHVLRIHRSNGLALKDAVSYVLQQIDTASLEAGLMRLVPVANNRHVFREREQVLLGLVGSKRLRPVRPPWYAHPFQPPCLRPRYLR